MKFRLPTDEKTAAARTLSRRPVLVALSGACVLAHAAVLAGLPQLRAAPSPAVAQHSVMQLTNVSVTMPSTQQRDAAEPYVALPLSTLTEAPARKVSAPRTEPARPAPAVLLRESAPFAAAAPPLSTEASIEHLPTSALDVPPMPRSAPDEQYVEHVHRSGLPIHVRLYIDATGTVTDTNLLSAAPGDEEAAEQVIAMFRDTAFMPGRLQGREVPSFIDIELVLEPQLPAVGRIFQQ